MSLSFSTSKGFSNTNWDDPKGFIFGPSRLERRSPLGGQPARGIVSRKISFDSLGDLEGLELPRCTNFMESISMYLLTKGCLSWSCAEWLNVTDLVASTWLLPISEQLRTSVNTYRRASPYLTVVGNGLLLETVWQRESGIYKCKASWATECEKCSLSIRTHLVQNALQSQGVSIDDILVSERIR
jgi:hypothetical protein